MTTTVKLDKAPNGGGVYLWVIGRSVASAGSYSAKVHVSATGATKLSLVRRDSTSTERVVHAGLTLPGVTVSPAKPLNVRLVTTGVAPTTLRVKAWTVSTAEPAAWSVTATDTTAGLQAAGVVGSSAYLSASATNAPVVVGFAGAGSAPVNEVDPGTPDVPTTPSVRAAADAGSVPVGTARYTAPSGARYVSPSGSDSAAGTAAAPWRTVAKAISASASGSTIVLRGGSYHESVSVPDTKKLTIQAAAGEAVWFDGSKVVSAWTADGGDWRLSGWTASFDHSPTYTEGAPDSTEPGWSFVNADYPMAAYPEQIFVDGRAQQQVKTRDAVVPGTFYADRANDRIILGTDPRGREVRSSALQTAITLKSAGSSLRGVGVRRYATSLPLMGTVRGLASGITLEDVQVTDNATQGVFLRGSNIVVRRVTSSRNGLMGLLANHADGLRVDGVRADDNNTEHFNGSPAAGGFKLTRLRGVSVKNSEFLDNEGSGLWFDESVYDATVTGNDVVGNTRNGISFEISSKALFADNVIARNGTTGLKINNAQYVSIWNNTIADNKGRPLWLVQDSRVASNLREPGHDPRRPLPDPTVTWILGPLTIKNNIIARGGSNCLVCLQDSALFRTAETIGAVANGNVYNRPTTSSPTWVATWADGTTSPNAYTSVSAFRAAKRQEVTGLEYTGANVLDSAYRPNATVKAAQATAAQPLDSAVATQAGRTAGERHLGAWVG